MPTSTRKIHPFYGGFSANPRWFPLLHRRGGRPCPPAGKCPFSRRSDANPKHFNGPMWASAPTNDRAGFHDFVGGQGRPPLQMKFDRPFVSSNPVHQISVVPRYFRRGKSSGFANAGRIREIYILRRRGRCPHRPAESTRFMVLFRRIRVDFPFCTVGADDPVRPRKMPVFVEIRCEFATF